MKPTLITPTAILTALFLSTAPTALVAASPTIAAEMQEAVLKTQDIRKVQQLLEAGLDINAPIGCGNFSPLDGAVETQNVDLLKFLLSRGAKPRGHELANAAFASGHQQALEMVQALLEIGVPQNARNNYSNVLIRATYRGNHDLVRLLLHQSGIKLDETDVDSYTALMWAVKQGNSDIINLLIRAGADPDFTNKRRETAVMLSEREIEKQRKIISILQSASK